MVEERKVSLNFNTILAVAITINENEAMRKIIAKEEKPEIESENGKEKE